MEGAANGRLEREEEILEERGARHAGRGDEGERPEGDRHSHTERGGGRRRRDDGGGRRRDRGGGSVGRVERVERVGDTLRRRPTPRPLTRAISCRARGGGRSAAGGVSRRVRGGCVRERREYGGEEHRMLQKQTEQPRAVRRRIEGRRVRWALQRRLPSTRAWAASSNRAASSRAAEEAIEELELGGGVGTKVLASCRGPARGGVALGCQAYRAGVSGVACTTHRCGELSQPFGGHGVGHVVGLGGGPRGGRPLGAHGERQLGIKAPEWLGHRAQEGRPARANRERG